VYSSAARVAAPFLMSTAYGTDSFKTNLFTLFFKSFLRIFLQQKTAFAGGIFVLCNLQKHQVFYIVGGYALLQKLQFRIRLI